MFFFYRFGDLLNRNNLAYYHYLCALSWLEFRLNLLGAALTVTTALLIVLTSVYPNLFGPATSPLAGLALSYALTVSFLIK